MTAEEMERTMQFILEQQAQFSTDIQQLKETSGELLKSQMDLTQSLGTLVGIVGQIAEAQVQLSEAQTQLANAHKRTENTVAELADRVNVFIAVVERHITGNGKEKPRA